MAKIKKVDNDKKEYSELESDSHILKNGDKVEVSSCSINNDVGGTTIIRNSRFKDEVDGMNLTIEYPDGKIEHTIIQSTDKLVQLLIEVEVLDKYYDYETGYRYKGKMINKELIKEKGEDKPSALFQVNQIYFLI